MKISKSWWERLGLLCLFLAILSFVIFVAINNPWLYSYDAKSLNLAESVGLTHGELMKNYHQLMNYLNFPWIKTLKMANFPVSASGALHFYEVKRLFLLDYAVLIITIIPAIYYVYRLVRSHRLWKLIAPFRMGAIIPVIFGFVMLIGFNRFFVMFHEIFFNNDAWVFDPSTDPVIWVLPEEFFMHCFILFFILLELFFIIGIIIGKISLKKLQTQE